MTFRLFSVVGIIVGLAIFGCAGNDPTEKSFKVLVLSPTGEAIENASVTPKVKGHTFNPKFTKIDGIADLIDVYSQKPTSIMVRAIGYKTRVIPWALPSDKPQTVVMQPLSIPDE